MIDVQKRKLSSKIVDLYVDLCEILLFSLDSFVSKQFEQLEKAENSSVAFTPSLARFDSCVCVRW